MGEGYFLGRQPIIDIRGQVAGYELLYRAHAGAGFAEIEDADAASLQVMVNAFANFGASGVLGPHKALLNITRDVLFQDLLLALPRDRVVLELLENIVVDDDVVRRCEDLRRHGYQLAFDDYILDDPREPYLGLVEIIKIDLPAIGKEALGPLVSSLCEGGQTVLAEKVETEEEWKLSRAAGCTLFQGYFFAKPKTLVKQSESTDRAGAMRVLALIQKEASTEDLAESIEARPNLGMRLLRIANSALSGGHQPIASLRDVVVRLGRDLLERWLAILLLADTSGHPNGAPFLAALHSARLLELLAQRTQAVRTPGAAFLAGILRATALASDQDVSELANELELDPVVAEGVCEGTGPIGALLEVVASLGSGGPSTEQLQRAGLERHILQEEEAKAYGWVHQMADSLA